jgi:hypothetical protein
MSSVFRGGNWSGVQVLLRKIARMLRDWRLLNKPEAAAILEAWAHELESRSCRPPRLGCEQGGDPLLVILLSDEIIVSVQRLDLF